MTRRRVVLVAAALAVSAGLGGCSQIAALAPVGGDAIAEVRFGTIDVLVAQGVELLEAPTCSLQGDGPAVSCEGTTTAGEPVLVSSSTDPDATLEVTVAGTSVYSGSLQSALDAAARP